MSLSREQLVAINDALPENISQQDLVQIIGTVLLTYRDDERSEEQKSDFAFLCTYAIATLDEAASDA